MRIRFPVNGKITAGFDQPRPLVGAKTHIHGGIDIAAPVGTPIYTPVDGKLYYMAIFRSDKRTAWNCTLNLPWQNYFYDIFGGVIIVKDKRGPVHLFCHSYFNQLYNLGFVPSHSWQYIESPDDERYPVHGLVSLSGVDVKIGDQIGAVGNAGYSTGPHCHYEIHSGWHLTEYKNRMNPFNFCR